MVLDLDLWISNWFGFIPIFLTISLISSTNDAITSRKNKDAGNARHSPNRRSDNDKNLEAVSLPQPLNTILGIKRHADSTPPLFGAKIR